MLAEVAHQLQRLIVQELVGTGEEEGAEVAYATLHRKMAAYARAIANVWDPWG
jgi:hypothetical protein